MDSKKGATLALKYICEDFWSLPVYQDQYGRLWKDIAMSESGETCLYSFAQYDFNNDPESVINEDFEIVSTEGRISSEKKFQYQMLGRLQSDCNYYLGFGYRNKDQLYWKEEHRHIQAMKEIWNSFSTEEKPQWITLKQIEEYEQQMCVGQ